MRVPVALAVIWSVQMYAGFRPASGPEPVPPPKGPPPSGTPMSAGHAVTFGSHGRRSPTLTLAGMRALSLEVTTPPSLPPDDGPPDVRSRRDSVPLSHVE